LREDQGLYLAAGMTDCLTKPVVRERLAAAIRNALPGRAPVPGMDPHPPEPAHRGADGKGAAETGALFDQAAIDGLRADVGEAVAAELMTVFADDLGRRLDVMAAALAAGDIALLIRQCHSITGAAATFGSSALASAAERAELIWRRDGPDAVPALAEEALRIGRTTQAALAELVGTVQT
jgi:hypothetical protein